MNHRFPRAAVLVWLVATVGSAHAASTRTVSIETAAEQATSIEMRHADGADATPDLITTHYFTGGAMMMAWGDRRVLLLCPKSAYLKLPDVKPAASALPLEARQSIGYQAMMAGYGGIAAVGGLVNGVVEVADDGHEMRRQAERPWAYGIERYDVISQRLPDGALRVRALKTATVNNARPSRPDDRFSTDEDQAARLAELGRVGSWTEITIHDTPGREVIDPGYALKDWVSVTGDQAATVAEARRINGCP